MDLVKTLSQKKTPKGSSAPKTMLDDDSSGKGFMTKQLRKDSRIAAEKYAPAPQGSSLLYGLIAVIMLGMTLWILGRFYSFSFLGHPAFLISVGAVAFCGGFILRRVRMRRHEAAYVNEFNKRNL